jgi:hypothetical protein
MVKNLPERFSGQGGWGYPDLGMGASRHILFLNTLPVFLWRHSGMFSEEFAERRLVAEAHFVGNLLDRNVGFTEQDFGFGNESVVYPFDSGFIAVRLHDTRQITGRSA